MKLCKRIEILSNISNKEVLLAFHCKWTGLAKMYLRENKPIVARQCAANARNWWNRYLEKVTK